MKFNWQRSVMLLSLMLLCACGGGGGESSAASVPAVNNLVLNASRVTGVAPLAVSFDTVGTTSTATSLPFHEMKYSWTFGDPAGGATWAYGAKAGTASKNAASGPVAAHVFETHGTYTVTVTSFDGTTTMTRSTVVTVTNPDVVFASNTLCVSNTTTPVGGDADGCPVGAQGEQIASWSLIGTRSATYKRILLKRGDTWNTNARANMSAGPGIIGAYGSGAVPRVIISVNENALYFLYAHDWRVMDMRFSSAQSGTTLADNSGKVPVRSYASNNLTMLRLNIHDVYLGLQPEVSNNFSAFDSNVHDMFPTLGNMVAFFYLGHRVSLIGNRFSNSPTTHTVRISGTSKAVISNNLMDIPGATRDALTLRGWENPTPYTEHVVVGDNIIDGGTVGGYALYAGVVNNTTNEELRNVIVERNIVRGNAAVPMVFGVAENLTVRNNLVISNWNNHLAIVGSGNLVGAPTPKSSYIYNNTFNKPDTTLSFNYSAISLNGAVTGVVMKNNLVHGPGNTSNSAGSLGPRGTFLYAWNGVTPANYTLSNNSTDVQLSTIKPWAAVVAANAADFTPIGYAAGGGVIVPVWDDYFLVAQTGTRSLGMIKP